MSCSKEVFLSNWVYFPSVSFSSIENHTRKYILSTQSLLGKRQDFIMVFYQGGGCWFENLSKCDILFKTMAWVFVIRSVIHNEMTFYQIFKSGRAGGEVFEGTPVNYFCFRLMWLNRFYFRSNGVTYSSPTL